MGPEAFSDLDLSQGRLHQAGGPNGGDEEGQSVDSRLLPSFYNIANPRIILTSFLLASTSYLAPYIW